MVSRTGIQGDMCLVIGARGSESNSPTVPSSSLSQGLLKSPRKSRPQSAFVVRQNGWVTVDSSERDQQGLGWMGSGNGEGNGSHVRGVTVEDRSMQRMMGRRSRSAAVGRRYV